MVSSESARVRVGLEGGCHSRENHGHGFARISTEFLVRLFDLSVRIRVIRGRLFQRFDFTDSFCPTRSLTSNFILPAFLSASAITWSPCRISPSRIFSASGSCTSFL